MWSFSSKYPKDHFLLLVQAAIFNVWAKTRRFCHCPFKCKWTGARSRFPFQKRAELQKLMLWHTGNTQQSQALKLSNSQVIDPHCFHMHVLTNWLIGASQNTPLVMPLWCWHCVYPVMADCCFSLRTVFMPIVQRVSQMGGTFPYGDVYLRRNLENHLFWETGYELLWFIKKMSGWIFTITGCLFSHTAATQLWSNTL